MKTVNESLAELGFVLKRETNMFVSYEKEVPDCGYTQCLDLTYSESKQLIQSYEKKINSDLFNNVVGLTPVEMQLALEKINEMKTKSERIVVEYPNKKIKLFTHNDLDGMGCLVLLSLAYGKENIDFEYCTHDNINDNILTYIESGEKHDCIFITDIAPNEDVSEKLDKSGLPVWLLDHHKTNLWINKYMWANVSLYNIENNLTSGTELVYDYLIEMNVLKETDLLNNFVWCVRRYDTWEWKTKFIDGIEAELNQLLYIMRKDEFVDDIIYKANNELLLFNSSDTKALERTKREKESYMEYMLSKLNYMEILSHKIAYVYDARYVSEFGNLVCSQNPDVDLFMSINLNKKTVEMRSVKDDIDLSVIASTFGGGGHKSAAGFPLQEDFLESVTLKLKTSLVNKVFIK